MVINRPKCQVSLLLSSIILAILGILQIIFPPYELLMSLRIHMTPGLPPFEWWLNPPDEVLCKVYIFNVTNSERFSNGTDKKIKLQEIGPIIYREKLIHTNPIFNENGTLSYTSNRTLIYLPDRNPIDLLNQTIVMPNIAVLFIPSYFYNSPFFVRFGINVMIRKLDSEVFKKGAIKDFLWNMTDPIMDISQSVAPSLVPTKNVGILAKIYQDLVDNVTVYIGPKFNEKQFFKIDNVDGSPFVPLRKNCEDKVAGSSEGVAYSQRLTKNDTILYFRKTLCRIAELKYEREMEKYGMKGFRYEMDTHFYDRKFSLLEDCYKGEPELPNGLIDVSSCHDDVSVAASNPHFLHGNPALLEAVDGLHPDKELHTSYVEIEPNTGIPMEGSAKSQLNIIIKNMKGFNERLHKFSDLTIPLLWLEYFQEGLPPKIQWMLYIQTVIVPVLQKIFVVFTFGAAIVLLILIIRRRRECRRNLEQNKALTFESQKFLKS